MNGRCCFFPTSDLVWVQPKENLCRWTCQEGFSTGYKRKAPFVSMKLLLLLMKHSAYFRLKLHKWSPTLSKNKTVSYILYTSNNVRLLPEMTSISLSNNVIKHQDLHQLGLAWAKLQRKTQADVHLTSRTICLQSIMVSLFVPLDAARSWHQGEGFLTASLATRAGVLISSPASTVDDTNHKQSRHWMDGNVCVY